MKENINPHWRGQTKMEVKENLQQRTPTVGNKEKNG